MSVDIKDHRKFLESKAAESKEKAEVEDRKPLIEQSPVDSKTGDEKLDKMVRALAAKIAKDEVHMQATAEVIATQVQEEAIRLKQFEFWFTKGRITAFKEASDIPFDIMFESKTHTPSASA